jgi:hypothetical protein
MSKERISDIVTIPFEDEGYCEVFIDPDQNSGKEIFEPGDRPIISVTTSADIAEKCSGDGKLEYHGKALVEIDYVQPVMGEKRFTLQYEPFGEVQTEWATGCGKAKVEVEGRTLTIDKAMYGLLRIYYEVETELYLLRDVTKWDETLVYFKNEDDFSGYTTVDFRGDDSPNELFIGYLVVRDIVTRQPVPGTDVTWDGSYIGTTDAEGRVYLGKISKGTYDILLEPPSPYYKSNEDGIANDRVTIN